MSSRVRPSWIDARSSITAVCVAGTFARLLWLPLGSGTSRFTNPDSEGYIQLAQLLPKALWDPGRNGLGLSLQRPPGYPTFLWLTALGGTVNPTVVVVIQCLIGGALNVLLCWHLARRLFGPAAAIGGAILLALDPVSIGHSLQIGTETVFTTMFLVALLLIERVRRSTSNLQTWGLSASAGLAVGVLALTRPVMVYVVPLIAAQVWLLTARYRGLDGAPPDRTASSGSPTTRRPSPPLVAGVVALCAVSVITGWFVRNRYVADRWMFSTAQGQNLFDYGAAASAAEAGHMSFQIGSPSDGWSELDAAGRRLLADNPEATRGVDMSDPINQSDVWGRLGREALIDHPRGYVLVATAGLVRGAFGPAHTLLEVQLAPSVADRAHPVLFFFAAALLFIQYTAAVLGLGTAVRRGRRSALILLLLPASYYLLISAGPQMYSRFRVPVAPVICILGGAGISRAFELRAARSRRVDQPE